MAGHVSEIVLYNFKSYEGRVRVGPFKKFTCIVGPNGAGKSNLVDAVSFVLCVRRRWLRRGGSAAADPSDADGGTGEVFRDFVHRKVWETPADIVGRGAAVELIYVADPVVAAAGGDGQGAREHEGVAPHEAAAQEAAASSPLPGGAEGTSASGTGAPRIIFRRAISAEGRTSLQLNGVEVSASDYVRQLRAISILSEARNFLVFQGDVESAAHRQGKALTSFFEQVSGSAAFRSDFEHLAAEKNAKEDMARHLFTRRRFAAKEAKVLESQKGEAEEFSRLKTQRQQLQLEYFLFKLYCNECQTQRSTRERSGLQAQCSELAARAAAKRQEVESTERDRSQAFQAMQEADNAAGQARSRVDGLEPDRIVARSRLEHLQSRLEELRFQERKEEQRQQLLESQASSLQARLVQLEGQMHRLVAETEARVQLAPGQREAFERARLEAESDTMANRQRARELESQVLFAAGDRRRQDVEMQIALRRRDGLRRRCQDLEEGEGELARVRDRDDRAAQHCRAQLDSLARRAAGHEEERQQLQEERQDILQAIQDITATERQIEQERQLSQVSADLVKLMPGVQGRLVELCRPAQRRFHLAVNVAIGGHLDAIVVDTSKACRQGVRYLKERLLAPMTFMPLDSLRVPPLDARLREAVASKQGLRMAVSCITFDSRNARVFDFLLGDVVLADSLEEARRFAFEDVRRLGLSCRVVTLDGETISREGNLSISLDGVHHGSTRFDFAELDTSRRRLEQIDQRLYEIRSLDASHAVDRASLRDEAQTVEANATSSEAALARHREELASRRAELGASEAALDAQRLEQERLARREGELQEEQRTLEAGVSQAVVRHFLRRNQGLQAQEVQRLEREWRLQRGDFQRQESQLSQQLASARAELALVQQQQRDRPALDPAAEIRRCETDISELQRQVHKLDDDTRRLEAEVVGIEARQQECRVQERECERAASRHRQGAALEQKGCSDAERRLVGIDSELQLLRDTRAEIFQQALLEDVDLPEAGRQHAEQLAPPSPHDLVPLPDLVAAAAGDSPQAVARVAAVALDFAVLPEDKRAIASQGDPAACTQQEGRYQEDLRRLGLDLERRLPNLKAVQQLPDAAEEAAGAALDAAAARRDIEDVESRFEAVRKQRLERFMGCFQKVQAEIDGIYKRLTAGAEASAGGSAFLDLEDQENPFSAGIKFTAMPPSKRFCDIGQLSCGERALAALALLFAVHAHQKPPFLVLDEVDAHLDARNIQALASFIMLADCQTIIVSLKDQLFTRCEGMVGVTRDTERQSSLVLTVDLGRFRAQGAVPLSAPPS